MWGLLSRWASNVVLLGFGKVARKMGPSILRPIEGKSKAVFPCPLCFRGGIIHFNVKRKLFATVVQLVYSTSVHYWLFGRKLTVTDIRRNHMQFKQIKPKRVSDQVFEQLRELIYKGDFEPGQQIPPERELAISMAVSRTSVRNAINKLVAMGLLEHRQGQGTYVASPENRKGNPLAAVMAVDEASLDDMLEVRMGVECNAARLAALRATDGDITAIAKSLQEMEEDLEATDRIGTNPDTAFHMAVTFATKNPVLIYLMRNFYDFLFVGIKQNLTHMYMDRAALEEVLNHHRAIYDAIKRRQPEKAHEAMQTHITFVQDYFRTRQ
jgi:GntR family transcriptional repressor for pyruvate dehydrogenase complex